jgi:hypothetical protein
MDAVKELAAAAGMEVPARSAEAAARDETAKARRVLGYGGGRVVCASSSPATRRRKERSPRAESAGGDRAVRPRLRAAAQERRGLRRAARALEAAGLLIAGGGSGLYRDRFRGGS